jgi:hypothetical protein
MLHEFEWKYLWDARIFEGLIFLSHNLRFSMLAMLTIENEIFLQLYLCS